MINIYRFLLPNCAQVLKRLTDILRGGGGAKTGEWTASAQEAFQNAKLLLAAAVPLQHPSPYSSNLVQYLYVKIIINYNKLIN
jgi:hypothetical protein